jgi:hypothetical protein
MHCSGCISKMKSMFFVNVLLINKTVPGKDLFSLF